MNLGELFKIDGPQTVVPEKLRGTPVSGLVFDTRSLQPGSVFVAIRGSRTDGHQFLNEAVVAGAIALVVEEGTIAPSSFKGFVREVKSTRRELARLAAVWSGEPSKNLFTVGVTGTNGKTTTTHMIESVLNSGGIPTGVIGTIDHHLGSKVWPTSMTTPEPIAFQSRLKDFIKFGAKAVALEASSHSLDQSRVDFVHFDAAVFTNLTRDHLDYHGTMDEYFEAKLRFFTELLADSLKRETFAILNGDDEWAAKATERILKRERSTVWTYAQAPLGTFAKALGKVDFTYEIVKQGFDGVRFKLKTAGTTYNAFLPMAGLHNVQNAMSAFAVGLAAGLQEKAVVESLAEIHGVNGRLEPVRNKHGIHVFVDYAHTDDALISILKLLGDIRSELDFAKAAPKIITVFGCGGDRDRGKRPLMMRAALNGSDVVVMTSDNPRSENPEVILDDAMSAVTSSEKSRVHRLVDRREAIARAVDIARSGDVVLIAGKGHETTQHTGDVKTPFSDVKVAREILEGRSAGTK